MKYISLILALSLLFACNKNKEDKGQAKFSNLTFSIDTVMVDPGTEIINLKNGLWISAIDPSSTYMYNWDQDNAVLEKINLDKLILEDKLPFEKEGPNGVGSYVSWFTLADDDRILFSNFEDMALFTQSGEKIRAYKMRGEKFEGDSLLDHESFNRGALLTSGGDHMYGILGNWTGKSFTWGKMDFNSKMLKKYPLTDFDQLSDYSVMLKSADNMYMISAPSQYINKVDNRIILSTTVFNSLMVYDLSIDSLYKVDYPVKLTKASKTGKYRNEVETEKEFQQEISGINQEVNFSKPIWDSKNQKFYRFSYENLPRETPLEQGELPKNKVYLTILDKDFTVLGESEVKELNYLPSAHFVKDGKIWLYHNIDDELAFVRLSIL